MISCHPVFLEDTAGNTEAIKAVSVASGVYHIKSPGEHRVVPASMGTAQPEQRGASARRAQSEPWRC